MRTLAPIGMLRSSYFRICGYTSGISATGSIWKPDRPLQRLLRMAGLTRELILLPEALCLAICNRLVS
jgi:hypothetical protein